MKENFLFMTNNISKVKIRENGCIKEIKITNGSKPVITDEIIEKCYRVSAECIYWS